MRKLALFMIIIFGIIVAVATAAFFNEGVRATLYNSFVGTLLMPIHDSIVSTAHTIAANGFTYIAVTSLALITSGIFLGYIWNHWLSQKLHLGHKEETGFQSTPSNVIPITGLQSAPAAQPQSYPQNQEIKKEQ